MYVTLLEISGFRGIKTARIQLGEHVVLLGPNNVGKSAVIDALALVLGRRGLVRDLWEHDFFGSSPAPEDRIVIRATISGFSPDDPAKHPSWFAMDASHAWWVPKSGDVTFGPRPDGATLAMQIGFAARFDPEDAEVITSRYFVDGDTDPFDDSIRHVKAHHLQELGFFLLPSHRTWDRILSFSSDLFRRTLQAEGAKPSAALLQLRDYLRAPAAHLENADGFKDVVERVERELASYVGPDEADLAFLPTTGDTDGVLRAITPHLVGKGGPETASVPMGRQGSGVISLQTILLLLDIGRRRRMRNEAFCLAAEEPELHLHPGHHRRLVARLRGVSDQSITTTHAPEVAAYYRPQEILALRNVGGELHATPLLREAIPARNALLRLYTILRAEVCEALMHRAVIVPEGETEFRWFSGLIRACATAEGWTGSDDDTLNAATLGVLPTQGASIVETFSMFRDIMPGVLPLCDGDRSGTEYVKTLARLKPAPRRIARLADELDLEGVLAWIIEPLLADDGAWSTLKDTIAPKDRTLKALREAVTAAKTRWDYHDAILALIATSETAAGRARKFISGLANLASESLAPSGWRGESSGETEIWTWDLPEKSDDHA